MDSDPAGLNCAALKSEVPHSRRTTGDSEILPQGPCQHWRGITSGSPDAVLDAEENPRPEEFRMKFS